MKIGEYKQAMSHMLKKDSSLENFTFDANAKLIDNDTQPIQSFANGGRAGFKSAGLVNNESVKAGELLSYLKKYGVDIHPGNLSRSTQMYGIKSPSSGRYILPSEDEIKTIKDEWYKNQQRAPATTEIGRKSFQERNNLVKELVSTGKYNPTEIKEIIQNKYNVDMGNTIWKEINQQRKEGKIIPSAREGETSTNYKKNLNDLNLLDKNKKIKNILSSPEFDLKKDYSEIFKEVKNTLNLDDSKTNYKLASLLKAYSEEKLPANKNIINNSNEIYSSYLKDRPFGSLGSVLYRKQQVEPGVASQINEDPNFFSSTRKKIARLLPGDNMYSTDELKNLVSSFENKTGPYSLFVQGIKKDINLGKGRTVDKLINQAEKDLQNLDPRDIDYLDKREAIKNKYNERVKEFTNKYNKDLKKGQLPVRGLELSFDSPENSLARYNELKKINPDLIKGVEDIYNKYDYSFKVPSDVKTIPEALGFVKSPEGQKFMQKASDLNASRVFADPTGIGNVLETSFGKALIERAPSFVNALGKVAKATGAEFNALLGVALNSDELKELGFSDLETIGRAAYKGATEDLANFGSMIYSAVAEAPFSKEPYFETVLEAGDRFKFARESAKERAEKMSTKERVDKIAEYRARKKFQQDYNESSYNPPTKEEFQKATELEKEGIFKEGLFSKKLYYEEEPKVNPLDKNIPTIFGNVPKEEEQFNFAKGGRVGFQLGGSSNFLKMLRNISDSILEIKNSTHMLGSTAKSKGIAKAAEEALAPFAGGFKGNKHETLLEKIQNAKEHLPKEYHGILDEMKSYADQHAYDAVDDMAQALDKVIDPNLKFESLPKHMFPMEDPLNDAFIIMDPERNHMTSRYINSVRIDPETGRGTREIFDTFDSETRTFLKKEDWKPVGVESIEKGKEGLN